MRSIFKPYPLKQIKKAQNAVRTAFPKGNVDTLWEGGTLVKRFEEPNSVVIFLKGRGPQGSDLIEYAHPEFRMNVYVGKDGNIQIVSDKGIFKYTKKGKWMPKGKWERIDHVSHMAKEYPKQYKKAKEMIKKVEAAVEKAKQSGKGQRDEIKAFTEKINIIKRHVNAPKGLPGRHAEVLEGETLLTKDPISDKDHFLNIMNDEIWITTAKNNGEIENIIRSSDLIA